MSGRILVISGPSGVGKTTVCNRLLERPGFVRSISATTRPPRPGEVDGRDYFFVSRKRFEEMLERGELLEHAEIFGEYYGTPRRAVEERLAEGLNVLLNIDVQGAEQLRRLGLPLTTIFLAPPDMKSLEERLRGRGTESEEAIAKRLKTAELEMKRASEYDYIVVNDTVERAVSEIERILSTPR